MSCDPVNQGVRGVLTSIKSCQINFENINAMA